jgi:hypothetical protein
MYCTGTSNHHKSAFKKITNHPYYEIILENDILSRVQVNALQQNFVTVKLFTSVRSRRGRGSDLSGGRTVKIQQLISV